MQERELVWDNCAGKGFLTDFRTDCHGNRQPQDYDGKRRKKCMTHPLGDTHPAQLLPGQANGAPDLSGCCADGAELSIALYFIVHRDTENTLDDYISAGKHKGGYTENSHKVNRL